MRSVSRAASAGRNRARVVRWVRRSFRTPIDPVGALLIGETPAISAIRDTIRPIWSPDSPSTTVLVVGESGTRQGHRGPGRSRGDSSPGTVVRVSHAVRASLMEPLLEVELFGIEPDGGARRRGASGPARTRQRGDVVPRSRCTTCR